MANQHRLLPDPVRPLSRLIDSTLTVADIVSRPIWSLRPGMSARDAVAAMETHGFDIAGVGPDPIQSYVSKNDLLNHKGTVKGKRRQIPASKCVEQSLPIGKLFGLLVDNEQVFVLDGDQVRWIVARADLAAPAVSIAVLSYLTAIEAGLKLMSRSHAEDEIKAALPEKRITEANELFERLLSRGLETELRDCLYLGDWLQFAGKTPAVRERLNFGSRQEFLKFVGAFGDVRNDAAHGRSVLASADAPSALRRIDRIREFCERVWRALDSQRPIWDAFASTVIVRQTTRRVLVGPGAQRDWPFGEPCHVVTAWNPDGIWTSESRNAAANLRLEAIITRLGDHVERVIGRSIDGGWREDSFAVTGLGREQAVDIGRMFGQKAIFEIDQTSVRVVRCDDASVERERTRSHEARS